MSDTTTESTLEAVVTALAGPGWGVFDRLMPATLWQALFDRARELEADAGFRAAGIGAEGRPDPRIRGDRIRWLNPLSSDPDEQAFFAQVEVIRRRINADLYDAHRIKPGFRRAPSRIRTATNDRRTTARIP